jgi:glycosyltransferase involved in cell wall biosynthesis
MMVQRVAIYHNILWSKYKGVVFSEIHSRSSTAGIQASFIQVAETDGERVALGGVDLSYHQYPYRLLFPGSYDRVSLGKRILALSRDLIRNPCDLVVLPGYEKIEYWAMLAVCMLIQRRRAVFCDSTIYDRVRNTWKEIFKGFFFRRCDGFFCYGIRSREYILGYGINEEKVNFRCQAAALPHGYDPVAVLGQYQTNRVQQSSATPRFLYVGRLSIEKGLADLLEAFVAVRASAPEARLDLVGAGPMKDDLIERAKTLGLGESITFLGSKNIVEIARLFMRSTALVLPSHSEPWGLVVNESLSYGCPVVVSNVCGCVPDLVIDGVTGYSFEAKNVQALSDAMLSILRMSTDRAAVAKHCLDVIANYNPGQAASQILHGCLRILQARP